MQCSNGARLDGQSGVKRGILREPSGFGRLFPVGCGRLGEINRWLTTRSLSTSALWLAAALAVVIASTSNAQTAGPVPPGLSFDSVEPFVTPISTVIGYIIVAIIWLWNYLMTHGPAATLVAALIALAVALQSISTQREIARLRETFNMINSNLWDQDYIKARVLFLDTRKKLEAENQNFASFAADNADATTKLAVNTILNHYENLALGVRHNILDEVYLCRLTRSALIRDWGTLSPLVTAYRHQRNNPRLYIEFEGLAASWHSNKSYPSNRKMKAAERKVQVH